MKFIGTIVSVVGCFLLGACGSDSNSSRTFDFSNVTDLTNTEVPAETGQEESEEEGQQEGEEDSGTGPLLSQVGNPVIGALNEYEQLVSNSLETDKTLADNIITWQMPHGGFYKNDFSIYEQAWDGTEARSGWRGADGIELGTIDNDATVSELLFLADVYLRSEEGKYRTAAREAMDFLLTMQYESGGWPQVYPARTGTLYSNHVTFNDDAMARVLLLLDKAAKGEEPLDGDLFSDEQKSRIVTAIDKGVEYILNSQIEQNGVKTVWCAQHDPVSYEPRQARAYEWPSKSGKESVLLVGFLMTRPQTPAVEAAVRAAIAWYDSEAVKVENTTYVRASDRNDESYNPIVEREGSTMWYRFYDLEENTGFFSGREPPEGQGKQYDIMDIEAERRHGYQWGGDYGSEIIAYGKSVGYD